MHRYLGPGIGFEVTGYISQLQLPPLPDPPNLFADLPAANVIGMCVKERERVGVREREEHPLTV